jgi:hypothetical protein
MIDLTVASDFSQSHTQPLHTEYSTMEYLTRYIEPISFDGISCFLVIIIKKNITPTWSREIGAYNIGRWAICINIGMNIRLFFAK